MSSRFHSVVLAVSIAVFCFASTGIALEKTSSRLTGTEREDLWRAGAATCSIAYYNTCTGWIWVWSGWSPEDRFGVHFYRAYPNFAATLNTSWVFFSTGSPSGYGFTGEFQVWAADDNGCPFGPPLATQTMLPLSSWNQLDFTGTGGVSVPHSFAITYTLATTTGDPVAPASDHPAAGPTGPLACGTCYPTTRGNRSFYFGTATTSNCPPGSAFDDGVCNAQLLWDAQVQYDPSLPMANCQLVFSVDESTWGSIKGLYR